MTEPTTSQRKAGVLIDDDARAIIDAATEAQNLSARSLISALVRGAATTGQLGRLVSMGVERAERQGVPVSPLPRKSFRSLWTADEGGGFAQAAAKVWRRGPWTLRYHGPTARGARRLPGDGWHLTGPGITEPRHVGWSRDDALRVAELLINETSA